MKRASYFAAAVSLTLLAFSATAAQPRQVSGIYPHLATFNNEGECGTGAVVPWADRLWVISYGPHLPLGSSDKLYEITPALEQIIRPESVGGTPANRMIHRESGQLLIGPYLIDEQRTVRVIPPKKMPGRLTGNARHLSDPTNKVYYGTMEEGLYEVDVRTLEVTGKIKDGNNSKTSDTDQAHPAKVASQLPGYHGKGMYSGQGRVVYANNGEHGPRALTDPTTPSGALAEWTGDGDWKLIRRNQFTEVTGPGGIEGNANAANDPLWTVGWDARSVILMVLERGQWHSYRLPKASHTYDGAHGWNTEWPRIRDIGKPGAPDYLMTMHGMFWHFPGTFSTANSAGIAPRSTYLKVIGDFCRWNNQVVLGCDDTAKSEFLNKRKAKGAIVGPGQSQSSLWFVEPGRLDKLGPAVGRGAVWLNDAVQGGQPSDPYLFSGFTERGLHLSHAAGEAVTFTLEIDARGNGEWRAVRNVEVPATGYMFVPFEPSERGAWIRIRASRDCAKTTAFFHYRNRDERPARASDIFEGLARADEQGEVSGGLVYARGANLKTLRFAAQLTSNAPGSKERSSTDVGCYDLGADLILRRTNDSAGLEWMKKNLAIPKNVLTIDAASVMFVDEKGNRWRLPKGDAGLNDSVANGSTRIDREVCTERDVFNASGTFYELPADNAGGFIKIRPIATHNRAIIDYCSYRGMLVMSGLAAKARASEHVVRSDDGKCALWLGCVDDLWQFGKPRGKGGPWLHAAVKKGVPSDPYLMTGYDRKTLQLSNEADARMTFRVEVDFTGNGAFAKYREFALDPRKKLTHEFPQPFGAYWVRVVTEGDGIASAQLEYE